VCAAFVQIAIDRGDKPHIIWQLPQYVLLTWAEIMVSVTCLEMAYTQAPNSMKSLIMAGWQMTVAIGNLVVIVVAETGFLPQWQEFLFFAGLMVMAALMYIVIAYHYKWIDAKDQEDPGNKPATYPCCFLFFINSARKSPPPSPPPVTFGALKTTGFFATIGGGGLTFGFFTSTSILSFNCPRN